tara:strand:+ start:101034 stop:102524 length:1491 start_codon:yes stop_codon:yes gene_type:complete
MHIYASKLAFIGICLFLNLFNIQSAQAQDKDHPVLDANTPLLADIDTTNQEVYVFLKKQLWVYSLETKTWSLQAELDDLPERLSELEFGLNPFTHKPTFWSRGVGSVYEIDTTSNSLNRLDLSFPHKNQFSHIPFFRQDNLYAFGGYGFWTYKNYISFFKPELKEWHLHTPDINSPLPSPRTARFGFYNKAQDAFFMYGGTYTKNNRSDDKNVERAMASDIWRYSFNNDEWKKLTSFTFANWKPYSSASVSKVGRINSHSTSAYSPHTKNWYLPFHNQNNANMVFHLVPFNIETVEVYKPVEIPIPTEEGFFISSYFYNPRTASFVFLGMDHLTNNKSYPLRIEVLPEDSLLQLIPERNSASGRIGIVVSLGMILVLGLFLFYKHSYTEGEESKSISAHTTPKDSFFQKLNENELKLFEILQDQEGFTDTHQLEEHAWPDIKNYDYRRKLRNESINSINEKFEAEFETDTPVISRKKDPKDNRRYLYGLNREVWDQ